MGFVRWVTEYEKGSCVVDPPQDVEDDHELLAGVSRAKGWPSGIRCRMNSDFPKDLTLTDSLHGAMLLVVSGRMKAALEERSVRHVEFLPVEILNHKGRSASKDYFILNPVGLVDCIDVQRSGVKWNRINPDSIVSCKGLALREKDVPQDRVVFRPEHWTPIVLVRGDLAESLEKSGLTGLVFRKATGFTGIG